MIKVYLIGFIGSQDIRKVRAGSTKEAKTIFARHHGIQDTGRITSHKWTGNNWNASLADSRPALSAGAPA